MNDLLNGSSTEQVSKDVTEIAQRCRNQSFGKVFISGIVYCTKVRYETNQNLINGLYEECIGMASVLLIMEQFRREIYGRMEYI